VVWRLGVIKIEVTATGEHVERYSALRGLWEERLYFAIDRGHKMSP
jgi:hypothetical protein